MRQTSAIQHVVDSLAVATALVVMLLAAGAISDSGRAEAAPSLQTTQPIAPNDRSAGSSIGLGVSRISTPSAPAGVAPMVPAQATETPGDPPSTTPTPGYPPFEPPPQAFLTVGAASTEAGIGTFCWGGMCACGADWSTSADPLGVGSPFLGEIRIDVGLAPTDMYMSVYRVESLSHGREYDGYRYWPPEATVPVGPRYSLPAAKSQIVQIARDPGLYVVGVNVYWRDVGDVAYAFLIEVDG